MADKEDVRAQPSCSRVSSNNSKSRRSRLRSGALSASRVSNSSSQALSAPVSSAVTQDFAHIGPGIALASLASNVSTSHVSTCNPQFSLSADRVGYGPYKPARFPNVCDYPEVEGERQTSGGEVFAPVSGARQRAASFSTTAGSATPGDGNALLGENFFLAMQRAFPALVHFNNTLSNSQCVPSLYQGASDRPCAARFHRPTEPSHPAAAVEVPHSWAAETLPLSSGPHSGRFGLRPEVTRTQVVQGFSPEPDQPNEEDVADFQFAGPSSVFHDGALGDVLSDTEGSVDDDDFSPLNAGDLQSSLERLRDYLGFEHSPLEKSFISSSSKRALGGEARPDTAKLSLPDSDLLSSAVCGITDALGRLPCVSKTFPSGRSACLPRPKRVGLPLFSSRVLPQPDSRAFFESDVASLGGSFPAYASVPTSRLLSIAVSLCESARIGSILESFLTGLVCALKGLDSPTATSENTVPFSSLLGSESRAADVSCFLTILSNCSQAITELNISNLASVFLLLRDCWLMSSRYPPRVRSVLRRLPLSTVSLFGPGAQSVVAEWTASVRDDRIIGLLHSRAHSVSNSSVRRSAPASGPRRGSSFRRGSFRKSNSSQSRGRRSNDRFGQRSKPAPSQTSTLSLPPQ